MLKSLVAAAIASLLLAAGCGGEESGARAGANSTPASSGDGETATVQQYASIVARVSDLDQQLRTLDNCNWMGSGSLDRPGSIVCQAGLYVLYLDALNLATRLGDAQNAGTKQYFGAPPEEIADLVDETVSDANALKKAAKAANDAKCYDSGAGRCLTLRGDVFQAMAPMESTLDAWEPYL